MKEFAPGIADKTFYGDLSDLRTGLATLVRQKHEADRAGLHEDLRIGTPAGMYSWAVPKFLPEDTAKRLAVRQPLHSWDYNEFSGVIPEGYGKGSVSRIEKSPVAILKSSPNHVMFTRGDSKDAPIYNLIRTQDRNWLLSRYRKSQPDAVKYYNKEHFKSVPVAEAEKLIDKGAEVTPKIDGAGALAYLGPSGVSVYGIRDTKAGDKPEYTDYVGTLRNVKVPKHLQGITLRTELYGVKDGKAIPPQKLSGILNSNLITALRKKIEDGIELKLAALAVNKDGRDVYDQAEVGNVVAQIGSDKLQALGTYRGDEAKRLLKAISGRRSPLTEEGVVIHLPGGRPIKAKNTEDYDVYIRNIFKAGTKADNRAGGFDYSVTPDGPVVGRVGTGFDHTTLKDMLRNPDKYVGRTARIKSRGQYSGGAHRAPSFISIKED